MAGDIPPGHFIGTSAAMRNLYGIIESAAASKATVFITGESGTGKEVCAQTIHRLSARADKPFIAINCAAIPRDLLESELFGHVKGAFTGATDNRDGAVKRAQGGVLFLDEICEITVDMQSKLLRFLQTLRYNKIGSGREEDADVRIICATNKNPLDEIDKGNFRSDLYYRLHVIPIAMPSLRGRGDDILDLADYFLHLYTAEEKKHFTGFSPDAEAFLVHHDWPGNVRELQNMIRYLIVLHDSPRAELAMLTSQLPVNRHTALPRSPSGGSRVQALAPLWQIEKDAIERAIQLCDGNIPRAAALLEISPSTIYRKKLSWEGRN
jgi:DNA-binding NtrC family response regulator